MVSQLYIGGVSFEQALDRVPIPNHHPKSAKIRMPAESSPSKRNRCSFRQGRQPLSQVHPEVDNFWRMGVKFLEDNPSPKDEHPTVPAEAR